MSEGLSQRRLAAYTVPPGLTRAERPARWAPPASAPTPIADEKPAPLGVFPITRKDAKPRSTIDDGAPILYMLRMTNDGISIHGSDVSARG